VEKADRTGMNHSTAPVGPRTGSHRTEVSTCTARLHGRRSSALPTAAETDHRDDRVTLQPTLTGDCEDARECADMPRLVRAASAKYLPVPRHCRWSRKSSSACRRLGVWN
jgi:hypothetical protein